MTASTPQRWPNDYTPSLQGPEAAGWGLQFLSDPKTFLVAQWAVCMYPKTAPAWWGVFMVDLNRYVESTGKEVTRLVPDASMELSFYAIDLAPAEVAPILVGNPTLSFQFASLPRIDGVRLALTCARHMVHELQDPTVLNQSWWQKIVSQTTAYYRQLH